MKKTLKLKISVVMLFILIFGSNINVNAYQVPGAYRGFVQTSSTSGYLYCGGAGVCATVIGETVYFGNYEGNWSYGIIEENNTEGEYYINDVKDSN